MAVYKPTLCYPFSNGMDIRTGVHHISETGVLVDPAQCLTCRIETSNVPITGYSVALFSSAHEQIFPHPEAFQDPVNKLPYVSPIAELQYESLGYDNLNLTGVNSGVNGSTLRIPFFRALRADTDYPRSLNAIYYCADYLVQHLISDADARDGISPLTRPGYTSVDDAAYWKQVTRTSGTYLIHTTDDDPTHFTPYYISPSSYVEPQNPDTPAGALMCDGEPLVEGALVGVILGAPPVGGAQPDQLLKGGVYEVAIIPDTDGGSDLIFALRLRNSLSYNSKITVWQGATWHNTTWEVDRYEGIGQRAPQETVMWQDTYGNPIALDVRAANYQWEITLYQGTTAIGTPLPIQSSQQGAWVDYSTIGAQWFDNIVTGGQITGSTPERLQLSDGSETFLPNGTDSDPLVLQDTFCSIFTEPAGMSTDYIAWSTISRFPVHDYDAKYGHIYPYAKTLLGLSPYTVEQWCAFYEHSTNPQEILDTDIIDYVYTSELDLSYWHVTDGAWFRDSIPSIYSDYNASNLWNGIMVTDRYLVVGPAGADNPNPTGNGGQILLTAQRRRWQNGVWQIKTMEAAYGNTTVKRYYLTRAAGYTTWGDFVGRIIYAMQPTSANYTSLAAAGAANVWNYQDVDMQYGRGDLVFSPERPILLFRDKLWHLNNFTGVVRSIDLANSYYATDHYLPLSTAQINAWQVGDYVADASGDIYYVAGRVLPEGSFLSYEFALEYIGHVSDGAFISVVNFAIIPQSGTITVDYLSGGTIYTWTADQGQYIWQQTWELHCAKILKNTLTSTYISPWVKGTVDARMSLKLLSPGTAVVANAQTTTDTIRIAGLNDVVYRIDHVSLDAPMEAYSATNIFIPYRYNICSYFRTSEPNPFTAYEKPYLRLLVETEILTNLASLSINLPSTIEMSRPLEACWATHLTPYVARKLNIGAEYQQFNHTMWESYQWQLYSANGTILQDTGRRYDGLIQTTFYGLANELSENVPYWVLLTVENNLGDVLEYGLHFEIVNGSASQFIRHDEGERCWFTAAYDCNTQSNLITFQWANPDAPTNTPPVYSVYRREYEVYERPGEHFEGYRQSSTVFTRDAAGTQPLPRVADAIYEDLTLVDSVPAHICYIFEASLGQYVRAATTYREFKGAWEPVVTVRHALPNTYTDVFRDFNISNGRSYQYIIYPAIEDWGTPDTVQQTFANYLGLIWEPISTNAGALMNGTLDTSLYNGGAILTRGDCWSLVELIPEKTTFDAPLINRAYHVDNDNIWLFRYDVETGEQTQNLARNEFANLGQYPKFGFGRTNYASGSVSAQLGSELVCSSKYKYIERLPHSRLMPLSTNEKAEMLKQWQAFVYSRNPKLLRDIKGQSWIVQILASSNRVRNYYPETPDTISFQWKEVGSPHNVIIYGDYNAATAEISKAIGTSEWPGVFAGLGSANASVPTMPYRITWEEVMWSFDTLNTGTEARIKLGSPPDPNDPTDFTYAISGAASGGVGTIGTVTDRAGHPVVLPATFDGRVLYLWTISGAPLHLRAPVEATITQGVSDPYVLFMTGDASLLMEAKHTAYDLIVVTNNAISAASNPAYIVATSGTAEVVQLDFTFPAGYGAPPSTAVNTEYIQVEVIGSSGAAAYTWTRDSSQHGHITLSGVSAALKVAVTGEARLPAPTLSRPAPFSQGVLEWTSVLDAIRYHVALDGVTVATTTTLNYNYFTCPVPVVGGGHAWTVYGETTNGVLTEESNPVVVQSYRFIHDCTNCTVDAGSATGVWDYGTATIAYTFTSGSCPWRLPAEFRQTLGGAWTWLDVAHGSVVLNGNMVARQAIEGDVRIPMAAAPALPARTISQQGTKILWSVADSYSSVQKYGVCITSNGTSTWQYLNSNVLRSYDFSALPLGTYDLSMTVFGNEAYNYATSAPSNIITVAKYTIIATTTNGASADNANASTIWSNTQLVLKYHFDGVNYICPTTGPTITNAQGVWTKVSDIYGELTLVWPTGNVSFTVAGTSGTSPSYTTYWDSTIEADGTVGTPPVAWDVTDQTLSYSFVSNGTVYDGISIDEYGCMYYKANNVSTPVFNTVGSLGFTGWANNNYRTITSTVDPDTVFLQDWAAFYDENTNGVVPTPLQWNFIMYADGLDTEAPDYWDVRGGYIAVSFRSNNVQYARIFVDSEGSIFYVTAQGVNTCVYDYISGWVLPAYRTIVCDNDPDLEFIDEWSHFYTANTVETRWRTYIDRGGDEAGPLQWDIRGKALAINFSSNGNNYAQIYGTNDPECDVYYGNTQVYDYANGFVNQGYQIITTTGSGMDAFNSGDWRYFYATNALSLFAWAETMSPGSVTASGIYFAFISNGVMYAQLYVDDDGSIYYLPTQDASSLASGTKVYDGGTDRWVNDAYREIISLGVGDIFNNNGADWADFLEINTPEYD